MAESIDVTSDRAAVPGLRERKRARLERDLVDAALTLFASKGYDATTIEDVAEVAGVSPRTFFRYHASKEELLFTLPNGDKPLFFITGDAYRATLATALAHHAGDDDLAAVGVALEAIAESVEQFREPIARMNAACASSAVLRGRKADAALQLAAWITEALAQHRNVDYERGEALGRVGMTLFSLSVERWQRATGEPGLASYIREVFAELSPAGGSVQVARSTSRRRRAIS